MCHDVCDGVHHFTPLSPPSLRPPVARCTLLLNFSPLPTLPSLPLRLSAHFPLALFFFYSASRKSHEHRTDHLRKIYAVLMHFHLTDRWPGLLLSKGGHGNYSMRYNLVACCTLRESETLIEESAEGLVTQKKEEKNQHPVTTRRQTTLAVFIRLPVHRIRPQFLRRKKKKKKGRQR